MHNPCNKCNNKKCFLNSSKNMIPCGDLYEPPLSEGHIICPKCEAKINLEETTKLSDGFWCKCGCEGKIFGFNKNGRSLRLSFECIYENKMFDHITFVKY